MVLNYISTCQQPTAVTASLCCRFTNSNELNLLIGKYNRLEVYTVKLSGIIPIIQTSINGQICKLESFTYKNKNRDYVIMLTDSFDIGIIYYNVIDKSIKTRCSGKIEKSIKNDDIYEAILRISPLENYALIYVQNGIIKLIPLKMSRDSLKMYNIRLNELNIIDIIFLSYNSSNFLHIAIMYKDRLSRNIRSYLIRLKDMELLDGPYSLNCVEEESTLLIPNILNDNGFIIVGRNTIVHATYDKIRTYSPTSFKGKNIVSTFTSIYTRKLISYLVGDIDGNLYLIKLTNSIKVIYLGNIGYSNTITYIDNGIIYLGSKLYDSYLIKLNSNKINDSYIVILETYINIAPIIDMEIYEKYNEVHQIITCSGNDKRGSLRILTNGVKMNEIASFDSSFNYNKIYVLKIYNTIYDNAIFFTNYNSSLFLYQNDHDGTFNILDTCSFSKLSTLYIGNVVHAQILQITKEHVKLINALDLSLILINSYENNGYIQCCSCNGWQFMICINKTKVILYNIIEKGIEEINNYEFNSEISCLTIYSLNSWDNLNDKYNNGEGPVNMMAVGFWEDSSLYLISLPSFNIITSEPYEKYNLLRSIMFIEFKKDCIYLLAAMGTGDLYMYDLSNKQYLLKIRNHSHLSLYAFNLECMRLKGSRISHSLIPGLSLNDQQNDSNLSQPPLGDPFIFTCCEHPSIIYYNIFKLSISYISTYNLISCSPYNSKYYDNTIIMLTKSGSFICRISDICSYNIQSIPIFESPHKIVHQSETNVFGLLTTRQDSHQLSLLYSKLAGNKKPYSLRPMNRNQPIKPYKEDTEISNFIIINENTFEPIFNHCFGDKERACSIISCRLNHDKNEIFAIGLGSLIKKENGMQEGRLVLFQYCDKNLTNISEYQTSGIIFSLAEVKGLLVCNAANSILILQLRSDKDLECYHEIRTQVMSLYCKSFDNIILTGDLIRSLTLYECSDTVSETARSHETNWLTAIEIIDKENFIFSNVLGGIFISTKDKNKPNQLIVTKCCNIDQQVNVFKRRKLILRSNKNDPQSKDCMLYATTSGMIGILLDIPEPWDSIFKYIQSKIVNRLNSPGDIDYYLWRCSFNHRYRLNEIFIDGDLLDGFLNIHPNFMREIVMEMNDFLTEYSPEEKIDKITSYIMDLSLSLPLIKCPI